MASSLLSRPSPTCNTNTISFLSSITSPLLRPSRRSSSLKFHVIRRRTTPSVQAKIREIFMSALSSTMTEGKLVSWLKSEGDVLTNRESVVVVDFDKTDIDVETFYDGILAAIVVGKGETAPVGAPIGLLAETEEEVAEAKAKAASSSKSVPSSPPPTPPSPPSPVSATVSSPSPEKVVSLPPVSDGPRKIVATPYTKKLAK